MALKTSTDRRSVLSTLKPCYYWSSEIGEANCCMHIKLSCNLYTQTVHVKRCTIERYINYRGPGLLAETIVGLIDNCIHNTDFTPLASSNLIADELDTFFRWLSHDYILEDRSLTRNLPKTIAGEYFFGLCLIIAHLLQPLGMNPARSSRFANWLREFYDCCQADIDFYTCETSSHTKIGRNDVTPSFHLSSWMAFRGSELGYLNRLGLVDQDFGIDIDSIREGLEDAEESDSESEIAVEAEEYFRILTLLKKSVMFNHRAANLLF